MNPRSLVSLSCSAFLRLVGQGSLGSGSASYRSCPAPVRPGRLLGQGRRSERWCRRRCVRHRRWGRLDILIQRWQRCGSWLGFRGRSRLCHGRCLRGWDLWCLLRRRSVNVDCRRWWRWLRWFRCRRCWRWFRCLRLPVSEIAPWCGVEHRNCCYAYAKQDRS